MENTFVQLWQVRYIVFYPNLSKSIFSYFTHYSRILPVAFKAVILLSLSRWRLRFVWFSKRRFLSKNTGLFKSKTENKRNSSIYSSYSVLRWLDFLSRNWLMTSCVLLKERCQFNIGILIFNIFSSSRPSIWSFHVTEQSVFPCGRNRALLHSFQNNTQPQLSVIIFCNSGAPSPATPWRESRRSGNLQVSANTTFEEFLLWYLMLLYRLYRRICNFIIDFKGFTLIRFDMKINIRIESDCLFNITRLAPLKSLSSSLPLTMDDFASSI